MSNNVIAYKGYRGSVDYSAEDDCLYGKLLDIDGLISYEAQDLPGIKKAFQDAVDEYIAILEERKPKANQA